MGHPRRCAAGSRGPSTGSPTPRCSSAPGDLHARAETGGRDEIGLLQGAFNDMADRLEEREAALRTSQETVEQDAALRTAILGSSPDGIVFSDPDGQLTYFNPAFEEVVASIVGRPSPSAAT